MDLRRVGQRGADDVLLPGRRARGQARARPRSSCASGGGSRSRWSPRSAAWRVPVLDLPGLQRGRRRARRAGAPRCRPTRPSRSACSRSLRRERTRLRVRLLTLVVVDDLVALVVIATVYTEHVSLVPLAIAVGLFGVLLALRYAPIGWRGPAAAIARRGRLGRAVRVGHRSGHRRPRGRPRHERLSAGAHRPRARDGADALVPRAADARARPLGAAGRGVGDLGERAAPVPPAPVDELRDRAAVRARQRRHPPRRPAARRRRHVADHARDLVRLRGRQAARHPRRVLARLARWLGDRAGR